MKILAIGNSFSQDAQRYLHQIAQADGVDLTCVNLYIGGCSLQTHYSNMQQNAQAYDYELNGEGTGRRTSIGEALEEDSWDCITLQQVSNWAPDISTYMPYIIELKKYVKQYAPQATVYLHQTWAYQEGSQRLCQELGYKQQKDMFLDIEKAYVQAAEAIGADGIIPCGQAFQNAIACGLPQIHRDTYHADLGIGRYILGLTWYQTLTGNTVGQNSFQGFDIEVPAKWISLAKQAVEALKG